MTLPKLLFGLMSKGVSLHEGAKGRIRFNPRGPVSPALKTAIQEHRTALLELLAGRDLDEWRMVRVRPPGRVGADDNPSQWSDPSELDGDQLEAMRREQLESENGSWA